MLQRYLVLEQTHVVVVTLEAVHHHEEMDSDEVSIFGGHRPSIFVKGFHDFSFADLVGALDSLHEDAICVDAVALFKDYRGDFVKGLLETLSLDF